MPGPVAVIVLSHRDPPLVRRLVDRVLQGRDTVVVSHHDPRGPALGLPTSDRVLLAPDQQASAWGQLGFALTMLRTLRFAREAVPELSWALLVSGQDYPCRPLSAIEEELHATPHDAFARNFRVDGSPADDVHHWQAVTRRRYLHRRRLPRTHRSIPWRGRHPFGGTLGLYAGDVWVNLGAAAVDHVLQQQERLPQVARHFARCPLPDEGYLATLLLNGADHLDIASERRRYVRWTPGDSHPAYLTPDDARKALASSHFFARKCDTDQTADALNVMDATLDNAQRLSPETGSA